MLGGLPRAALHAQVVAALQVLFQVRRGDRGRVLESICLLLPEGPERLVTRGAGLGTRPWARAGRPRARHAAAGPGRGGAADPQRAVARIGGSGMSGGTLLVAVAAAGCRGSGGLARAQHPSSPPPGSLAPAGRRRR